MLCMRASFRGSYHRSVAKLICTAVFCSGYVYSFSAGAPPAEKRQSRSPRPMQDFELSGDWASAKKKLRNPDCCVVSISGLESHLVVLQEQLDQGPAELDLRARISSSKENVVSDCIQVCDLCSMPSCSKFTNDKDEVAYLGDPSVAALMELAQGVASLADGPLEGTKEVFMRIVCASDYRARDPMYHTDKAPLRAYVTLRGVGTDFMTRPCSLLQYAQLRGSGEVRAFNSVRRAEELEFIVMKGDQYICDMSQENCHKESAISSWFNRLWKRTIACVHRSPPAPYSGGRRIILSLDIADGGDDQQWFQADKKREWRSGMTQRKSRLVA
mmetsp:Transcript_8136/g.12159  ORF Transcript_8136/g.12159 Transcript_8136/m.12159 type:complete len:329 (-) Transcript_8136:66-1052(-)